jgi:F-type H+-transporting ATPase subunit a
MKGFIYTIIGLAVVVLGALFFDFKMPVVSVAAEKIPSLAGDGYWNVAGFYITNAVFTSWVVTLLIIVGIFFGTRNMKLVPTGFQNFVEAIFETLYNLTENIAGPERAKKFYAIPIAIFIYVIISNWFGLLPFVPAIGVCYPDYHDDGATTEQVENYTLPSTCDAGYHVVPFFRSPSADLNNTLMLALFTQIAAQIYGFAALGFGGYLSRYFVFDGIKAAFGPDAHGNARSFGSMMGQLALGLIDMAVGLLELLGEFNKVIAYTFRLFGNIFAGEVMLIIITFLVPLGLTSLLVGFEIFVGFIQAFVFYILSVAFYTVVTTPHHAEEGAH